MIKYYGEIKYTIDSEHPDINYIKEWAENKEFTYHDTYKFDGNYEEEDIISYIKKDLKLVAGGGYNSRHIHNVEFKVERKL